MYEWEGKKYKKIGIIWKNVGMRGEEIQENNKWGNREGWRLLYNSRSIILETT